MAFRCVRVQLNGTLEFRAGGGEIQFVIEQVPAAKSVSYGKLRVEFKSLSYKKLSVWIGYFWGMAVMSPRI